VNRRGEGTRLDRNAQDYFVLDDQASDALLHRNGLHGQQAEQYRYEAEETARNH
jgi:hypothetical protein